MSWGRTRYQPVGLPVLGILSTEVSTMRILGGAIVYVESEISALLLVVCLKKKDECELLACLMARKLSTQCRELKACDVPPLIHRPAGGVGSGECTAVDTPQAPRAISHE